jgi:outer membrane receptor protein involved in Fe transport
MPLNQFKRKSLVIALVSQAGLTVVNSAIADEQIETETIIISGEKIERSLKDSTTAVTVVTEEELSITETQNVNEIAASTPNVINGGFGAVSIRGVDGTGAATGGYAFYSGARARVSTIVDGVSQSWSGYNFTPSKSWDVKQVEVYRGPQSTTQGTNSIGGAMVVESNDPTYYWEGAVRLGSEMYENENFQNSIALMASGPIIEDELAFRIAVDGSKGESYITYEQDDTELDDSPDLDDSENLNLRAKLLWEPAALPQLSAKTTVNYKTFDGSYLNWANDTEEGYSTQTFTLSDDDGDYTRIQDSTVVSIAGDVDYELTDQLSNSFQISYGQTDVEFTEYTTERTLTSDVDNVTVEDRLNFSSSDNKTAAFAGVYLSNTQTEQDIFGYFTSESDATTSAVFGEASYRVQDDLNLVAGLRYENETVDRKVGSFFDEEYSEDILLPKIAAIYDVNEDTVVSASIRKGYNAGGGSVRWGDYEYYTYDSETVWAYEAGLKTRVGGTNVTLNLFLNDYDDYQAFTGEYNSSSVYVQYIDNVDDAITYGLELEADAWVTDSTSLRASVGYTQSEVISDDDDIDGNELPNAPGFNSSVGVTQYFNDRFSAGADITYVGEYYSDLDNTDDYTAGDYVTADLRANYVIGDFSFDAYIKNLANEDVIYWVNGATRASVGQTRTIGFNATYRM